MADPTEIISLAELKSYLNVTKTDFDVILAAIKAAVEAFVKNYCHDTFLHATFTEYYDGSGSGVLILDHYPITAITEINIDSDRAFAVSTKLATANIISSDRNNQRGIVELFDGTFPVGTKNVKAVYNAGFATLPEDLKLAVKQICAREFLIQDKAMMGITSQNVGDKTVSLNLEDLPRNTWLILQAYKRPLV